jgi:hypothetical protein
MTTIGELVERCGEAYAALAGVAESVESEWLYIQDLVAAWSSELDRIGDARGGDAASPQAVAAVDRLIDEIEKVGDPHRAIDWLSTFPQAVLLALGQP